MKQPQDIQEKMQQLESTIKQEVDWKKYVRRHPLSMILGSLAAGYLLSRALGPVIRVGTFATKTAGKTLLIGASVQVAQGIGKKILPSVKPKEEASVLDIEANIGKEASHATA